MTVPDQFYTLAHVQENAVSATGNRRLGALVLLLFIISALFTIHRDINRGFDEVAHVSYVAYLQRSGDAWPAFAKMPMLDPSSFRFTGAANYLNHPSPYYLLLAWLGPDLEGHPEALVFHRLLNVALDALGLAALIAIGLAAGLPRSTFCAYIIPIACIPVLTLLAGSVSNDNAAFAGGAVATLGAYQLLVSGRQTWLLVALGGVVVASWAKFTALLLAGGLVGGVLLWLLWRGRLPSRWIAPIAVAALLACAPYIALMVQYGSPTPMTAGELAKVTTEAAQFGWAGAERLGLSAYVVHFVTEFALEWIPPWKPFSALYFALVIPIAAAICAGAGTLVAIRRIASGNAASLDVVIAAGALAFAATFVIHIVFGYRLHMEFGWLSSAYPRYYLPLAAIFPLAGLALLGEIKSSSARTILLGLLIAGAVVFRLLLEPLASG
jgi:hypothetical protein